jgi:hypothetical protein
LAPWPQVGEISCGKMSMQKGPKIQDLQLDTLKTAGGVLKAG